MVRDAFRDPYITIHFVSTRDRETPVCVVSLDPIYIHGNQV